MTAGTPPSDGVDAYHEIERLWRDVRDYESLCRGGNAAAPWRTELVEEPRRDPRCVRVEESPVEAYALQGTAAGDGVFLCPGALSGAEQRALLRSLLAEWALPPSRSNLWPPPEPSGPGAGGATSSASGVTAEAEAALRRGLASALHGGGACGGAAEGGGVERLRWVTLGRQYDWGARAYLPVDGAPPLPGALRRLAEAASAAVPLPPGAVERPFEAAICNLYHAARRPSDRLGGHKDDVEPETSSPLVSISLGLPCIFLLGGETRESRSTPVLLQGGTVLVMAGRARHAIHGVPSVLVPPKLQLRGRGPRPCPSGTFGGAHASVYFPWAAELTGEAKVRHLATATAIEQAAIDARKGEEEEQDAVLEQFLTRARVSFSIRSVGG